MGELGASQGESAKQRTIPTLRPGSFNFGLETVPESDPSVAFYDKANAASVRLFNETQEMVATPAGLHYLQEESVGSGAIVSSDGLVLTAGHVVENSKQLAAVTSSGDVLSVTPIFEFPQSDLALVQINDLNGKSLDHLGMSHANKIRENQAATAAGHPLGSEDVYLSPGNVLRVANSKKYFGNWGPIKGFKPQKVAVMTNHIKPGSSGSPVLNNEGEVIGVVSVVADNEFDSIKDGVRFKEPEKQCPGLSFAIPISTLKKALKNRPDLYKRLGF